jgi:hypothetical protein
LNTVSFSEYCHEPKFIKQFSGRRKGRKNFRGMTPLGLLLYLGLL